MTPSQVLSALLPDRIFRLPQAGSPVYVTREQYLSGDVGQKLSIAQRWAQLNPDFAVNVTALIAVQPKPLPPEQIQVSFGASFVPAAAYRAFVNHLLPSLMENWKVDISFAEATSTWTIDFRSRPTEAANTTTWGTPRCPC
jgi:N12 class adenine-specific DNA methylase